MNIDFSIDSETENSRYWITDACTSSYVDESDISLPESKVMSMIAVAKAYAKSYDHNGNDDDYAVCNIEDLVDGESVDFAFDGKGDFEWKTERQRQG